MINPSRKVSYFSFGYIPDNRFLRDVFFRLTGYPNLIKRLQARDILESLALKSSDKVIDFGCGIGYITVELAKQAKEAIGIDINPDIAKNIIPENLKNKLRYQVIDGRTLDFPDNHFDVALCSEVLMMIPDPNQFLNEVKRILKPGGKLVVVNGLGHPAIEKAYANNSFILKVAKKLYPSRFPENYNAYVSSLRGVFETAFEFPTSNYYLELLKNNSFNVHNEFRSPGKISGNLSSWNQYFLFLRTGRGIVTNFIFAKYLLFSFLDLFSKRFYEGGQIIVASSNKSV